MEIYKNLDINDLDYEVWKVIADFPSYQVSNLGRIKSFKRYKNGKILKQQIDKYGYLYCRLNNNIKSKHKKVHRLVLITFKPIENSNNFECNHKNDIKICNILENLEWCTQHENITSAIKSGLIGKKGNKNNFFGKYHSEESKYKISKTRKEKFYNKLKDGEVWLIKKILNSDYYKSGKISLTKIGKMFKIHRQTISDIKNNKLWSNIKYE